MAAINIPNELDTISQIANLRSGSNYQDIANKVGLGLPDVMNLINKYSDSRGNIVVPDANGKITRQQAVGFNLDKNGNPINQPGGFQYQLDTNSAPYNSALDKSTTDALGVPGGTTNTLTNTYTPPVDTRVTPPGVRADGTMAPTQQVTNNLNQGTPGTAVPAPTGAANQLSAGYDQFGNRIGEAQGYDKWGNRLGSPESQNTNQATGQPISGRTANTSTSNLSPQGGANRGQSEAPTPAVVHTPASAGDIYAGLVKSMGLMDVKSQLDNILKQQSDLQNQKIDEISKINSNPWLSEGIRNRQIEQIDKKYEMKEAAQTHLLTLYDSLYKEGLQQAQFLTGQQVTQQHEQTVLDQQMLIHTQDLAQKQLDAAAALAKDNQIVSLDGHEWLVNKVSGKKMFDLGLSQRTFSGNITNNYGSTDQNDALRGMLAIYQQTGIIPPMGIGNSSKALREQFYAAIGQGGAGLVSGAATNKAMIAGATTALKTQNNQYAANQTSIGTLDKQLNLVKQYSDEVSRSGSPFINKYLLAAKSGVFGDPKTAAFNNIVVTASTEFAKILSGSSASIAGVTVSSAQDAKNLLNTAMAKGQFNEVLGLMRKEAQFRLDSQKQSILTLQSDIKNGFNNANLEGSTFDNLYQKYGGK